MGPAASWERFCWKVLLLLTYFISWLSPAMFEYFLWPLTPTKHVFCLALNFSNATEKKKKKPTQQTTLHFVWFPIRCSGFQPLLGAPTLCKYDYGKYFTRMACGPSHKTLREQSPGLAGQAGPAALPGGSARAECCRRLLSPGGTKHFGHLSEPKSCVQLWMGNVCFDWNCWNSLVCF